MDKGERWVPQPHTVHPRTVYLVAMPADLVFLKLEFISTSHPSLPVMIRATLVNRQLWTSRTFSSAS